MANLGEACRAEYSEHTTRRTLDAKKIERIMCNRYALLLYHVQNHELFAVRLEFWESQSAGRTIQKKLSKTGQAPIKQIGDNFSGIHDGLLLPSGVGVGLHDVAACNCRRHLGSCLAQII